MTFVPETPDDDHHLKKTQFRLRTSTAASVPFTSHRSMLRHELLAEGSLGAEGFFGSPQALRSASSLYLTRLQYTALEVGQTEYESDFDSDFFSFLSISVADPPGLYYWRVPVVVLEESAYEWAEHYNYIGAENITRFGDEENSTLGYTHGMRVIADGGATSGRSRPHLAYYYRAPTLVDASFSGVDATWYTGVNFTYASDDYIDDANAASENGNGPPYTSDEDYWVAYYEVTDGGSGYTSEPTVTVSNDLSGNAPTARAVIEDGKVVAIWNRNPTGTVADNYASAPSVTISGGGGSGATAAAHLSSNIRGFIAYTDATFYGDFEAGNAAIRRMTQPWGRDLGELDWISAKEDPSGNAYWIGRAFIWGFARQLRDYWISAHPAWASAELRFYEVRVVRCEEHDVWTYSSFSGIWSSQIMPAGHRAAIVGSPLATVTLTGTSSGEHAYPVPSIALGTWVVPVVVASNTISSPDMIMHIRFDAPAPEYIIPAGRDAVVMPA